MTFMSSTPNEGFFIVNVIIGYPVARRYLDATSGINYTLLSITPRSTIWHPNRIDKHNTKWDTAFLYMKSQHQCVFVYNRAPLLLFIKIITWRSDSSHATPWITGGGKSFARTIDELGITMPLSHVMRDATNQPTVKSNIRRTSVGNRIVDHSRRCSNYIFVLDLTAGFIGLGQDNCKTKRETFKLGNLVRLILDFSVRYAVVTSPW